MKTLDAINRDRARRALVEETAKAKKTKSAVYCARCGCTGRTCEVSVMVCDVVIMYGKCVPAGTLGFKVCSACEKKGAIGRRGSAPAASNREVRSASMTSTETEIDPNVLEAARAWDAIARIYDVVWP